jgi:catechol 2,3-dioxygenase-like lactoylglutathione lyase family enzyme
LARESTFGTTIVLVERESDALRRPRSASNLAPQSCVHALDHVVITTAQPERAAALYGARLGLEMKLDRSNPDWGSRLLFFKSGDLIVEVAHSLKNIDPITPDKIWGLSWRVTDIASAHERMRQSDLDLSEIRTGRKPGTQVFTVRNAAANVPTLVIGRA